ncbi:MAG: hypothetical protein L0H55_11855 [Candidatus Nitrosocosmicus sp.]|nr:hypothetical protein [Candidatus Nitrosocosmicus sp.]
MTILFSISILFMLLYISKGNIVNAVINVGDPDPRQISPYTKIEGVPQIIIKNDNTTYQGALRVFTLVTGDVNDNMPSADSNSNISAVLPKNAINISQNEQIQLLIRGNPQPELQPSTLSSTIYFTNGTGFKVLSLADSDKRDSDKRDTFLVDVPKGRYFLLTTATWLPNPDNYLTTSGYVVYAFRLNVQ